MAGSQNKVFLIGNLGRDPEVRTMQNGEKCVNLSLATSQSWKDKNTGEKKERTEWHRVVIFNQSLCEIAKKYLVKGSKCHIEGALQTRKWQNQEGKDVYTTEVVLGRFSGELILLDAKGNGSDRLPEPPPHGTDGAPLDDEIPF